MQPSEGGRTRLAEKLGDQLAYLETSCQLYDEGHEREGIRIANTLRQIFHTGNPPRRKGARQSLGLLQSLGMGGSRILGSPVTVNGDWRDLLSLQIEPAAANPVRAIPRLGDKLQPMTIAQWWCQQMYLHEGIPATRCDIVLTASNQDGGAHVDSEVAEQYKTLTAGAPFIGIAHYDADGNQVGASKWPSNGHVALLRQFGFEVLATSKIDDWLGTASAPSRP